jgi:hypothetical protein
MTIAPAFPCRFSGPQNGTPPAVTHARAHWFQHFCDLRGKTVQFAGESVAKVFAMRQNKSGPESATNASPALDHRQLSRSRAMTRYGHYTPLGAILNPEISSSVRGVAS